MSGDVIHFICTALKNIGTKKSIRALKNIPNIKVGYSNTKDIAELTIEDIEYELKKT